MEWIVFGIFNPVYHPCIKFNAIEWLNFQLNKLRFEFNVPIKIWNMIASYKKNSSFVYRS